MRTSATSRWTSSPSRGRTPIVTGGNTGLGQAFTLALATAGANVFVPSIVDDDGSTGSSSRPHGGRYEFMKADITAPGAPAEIVGACVDRLGSLDILVNSAGICPLASVLDFGRPQWDATVAVNLTAAFEMGLRGREVHDPAAQRQDHQHLLALLVSSAGSGRRPTRPPSTAWPASPRRTATSSPSTTSRSTASPPATTPPRSPRPRAATRRRTSASSTTSRRRAGASRWTSWERPSSSPAAPPTTSTATCSWSTAAISSARTGRNRTMAGKYLIGIDNGTQSTKVVIYDLRATSSARRSARSSPWSTLSRGTPCTPTTTSGSRSSRPAAR